MACAASPSSSTLPAARARARRARCRAGPAGELAKSCAADRGMQRQRRRETRARRTRPRPRCCRERQSSAVPRARQEQRRGEAAVGVRQRDQHEAAARPDVQRVALERRAAGERGYRELLVVVVEPLLARLQPGRRRRGWRAPPSRRRRWRSWGRARVSCIAAVASSRNCSAVMLQVRAQTLLAEAHAARWRGARPPRSARG